MTESSDPVQSAGTSGTVVSGIERSGGREHTNPEAAGQPSARPHTRAPWWRWQRAPGRGGLIAHVATTGSEPFCQASAAFQEPALLKLPPKTSKGTTKR